MHEPRRATTRRADRLLAGVALALVLSLLLFEGVQMTRGTIAYGDHPAALVGTWRGRLASGATATLTLDPSGRFTDRVEPDAGDDRRGHWGAFALDGRPGVARVCLRAPDGRFERCVERVGAGDSLVHPYRGIGLRRSARRRPAP